MDDEGLSAAPGNQPCEPTCVGVFRNDDIYLFVSNHFLQSVYPKVVEINLFIGMQ
jgi:hypothetical protein